VHRHEVTEINAYRVLLLLLLLLLLDLMLLCLW
jgi:hypothetical protein